MTAGTVFLFASGLRIHRVIHVAPRGVGDLDDGRPCGRWHSARRNFILLVPGLNVVAAVLETLATVRDPQGQRLGDILANTQVVEGVSVKELATSLQQVLLELPIGRQRDEQPVEVK